jgi:hypothetical protein
MEFDAFIAKYTPIKNHFLDHSAVFNGFMFETLGPEFEFVNSQDPLKIWTIIDAETDVDSDPDLPTPFFLIQGCHLVNRIGHIIASSGFLVGDLDQYEC